jgi:hypothetical protein
MDNRDFDLHYCCWHRIASSKLKSYIDQHNFIRLPRKSIKLWVEWSYTSNLTNHSVLLTMFAETIMICWITYDTTSLSNSSTVKYLSTHIKYSKQKTWNKHFICNRSCVVTSWLKAKWHNGNISQPQVTLQFALR